MDTWERPLCAYVSIRLAQIRSSDGKDSAAVASMLAALGHLLQQVRQPVDRALCLVRPLPCTCASRVYAGPGPPSHVCIRLLRRQKPELAQPLFAAGGVAAMAGVLRTQKAEAAQAAAAGLLSRQLGCEGALEQLGELGAWTGPRLYKRKALHKTSADLVHQGSRCHGRPWWCAPALQTACGCYWMCWAHRPARCSYDW
jgi:hypothetical protein